VGGTILSARENLYFNRPVIDDSSLARQLSRVFSLVEQQEVELLEIQSLFYSLLTDLLQHYGTAASHGSVGKSDIPGSIDRACQFINDMAVECISLDDIAREAGLSRYHFLRVFNSAQGMTPHAYLLQRRLQLAREAIRQGTAIGDAAISSSFADQSHFTRRFKAAYGITPRQFQKAVC